MWLIRFHLIEPRDYNRISRMCERSGFIAKKFSPLVLVKGILLHIFAKKSWRAISQELGVPHIPIYNLYRELEGTPELREILEYVIMRRIVLFTSDERYITREMLDSEEIIRGSLEELQRIL